MSIQVCPNLEQHTGHRFGESDDYCVGQYLSTDGTWRNHKLSRGKVGKPHFFLDGEQNSICGYGHKSRSKIVADVCGRNVCNHCERAVIPVPVATEERLAELRKAGTRTLDPKPYVDALGERFAFHEAPLVEHFDGAVRFAPRDSFADAISVGSYREGGETHLYANDWQAFCDIKLPWYRGLTVLPSVDCPVCLDLHYRVWS